MDLYRLAGAVLLVEWVDVRWPHEGSASARVLGTIDRISIFESLFVFAFSSVSLGLENFALCCRPDLTSKARLDIFV